MQTTNRSAANANANAKHKHKHKHKHKCTRTRTRTRTIMSASVFLLRGLASDEVGGASPFSRHPLLASRLLLQGSSAIRPLPLKASSDFLNGIALRCTSTCKKVVPRFLDPNPKPSPLRCAELKICVRPRAAAPGSTQGPPIARTLLLPCLHGAKSENHLLLEPRVN
jgi:hypothetical protein